MIVLMLAGLVALSPVQTTPAAPARVALDVQIPELSGTSADPTCGGQPALAQQAFCVATTMAAMQAQADQYDAAFRSQGWLAADGGTNLTIYVRRREAGGCESFQQLAFADDARAMAPGAPAYFAFAAIPVDICKAAPAASDAQ